MVSVARKTDAAMWPALFAAVGAPSALLEGLLGAGALASAACCLLIVDRIEGPAPAHALALRLIRARRPARPCCRDVCITCRIPRTYPHSCRSATPCVLGMYR